MKEEVKGGSQSFYNFEVAGGILNYEWNSG